MNRQGDHSKDPAMQNTQHLGSSIESKSPSRQNTKPMESEEQKAARPRGVGEEVPALVVQAPSHQAKLRPDIRVRTKRQKKGKTVNKVCEINMRTDHSPKNH